MSIRIALAGNPNCGKTTLFNALTGSNQYVGNWPGVTVEKKEGNLKNHDDVIITDLPGIYSLSPYTMEEVVARNYLVKERPDAILNIIDGTNLERNLYLTTQLTDLGIPVVVAINMMDIVIKNGDIIREDELAKRLRCRVVVLSALKGDGILDAAEEAIKAAEEGKPVPLHIFSGPVEHAIAHIEEALVHDMPEEQQRWYAIKIFERDEKVLQEMSIPSDKLEHIEKDIKACESELDDDAESIIINDRYGYVEEVIKSCYKRKNEGKASTSDKIDRVLTNRWLGLPLFAVIMFFVYWIAMVAVGTPATDFMNDNVFGEGFTLFGAHIPGIPVLIEMGLDALNAADWLKSLILDGIVSGVGSVLGFVPQMLVLFFLLSFLEACGYMSRIAFVLDKVFRRFGLSGKSFIPMLVGVGCGVPGIMASRTIENERDRRMTIMTTTFIPCGAKLPLIALISGALFKGSAFVSISAYLIGVMAVLVSGLMLKKTKMFIGEESPFVMELPAYHMPTLGNIWKATWERGWSFIKKAGTVILISTMVLWFATYFGFTAEGFRMLSEDELDVSILAAIGNAIAWIFIPLGWGNWQAVVASITGLIAKENIVGTMGVLYGGTEAGVWQTVSSVFTGITGFSFLVFNLLCAPCFAAIGAIKREMNSAKWTWFAIGYQCGFAYVISLMINQFGGLFTGNANVFGVIAAAVVLCGMIYMLFFKKGAKGACHCEK